MNEQISDASKYVEWLVRFGLEYGLKILGGILVLIAGLWISNWIARAVNRSLGKRGIDPSLLPFLKNLTSIILKILVVITVMSMIGIQMTSFIAILGAAGLAVGMALSGTLQNFAGGIILLVFRPFRVGDFIEAQGYTGIVKEIGLFSTIMNTVDKKMVYIPNGPLATGSLINYSAEPLRRVDWVYGIAYGDDMEDFKRAMQDFIREDERILADPEPFIGLNALADSSVNFVVRTWVNAEDYWPVFFDMNEKVYKRFADYGLHIPFPQMDVHMHGNADSK